MKTRYIAPYQVSVKARTLEIENTILAALEKGLEVDIADLVALTGVSQTNLHDTLFDLNCRFIIRGSRRRIKVRHYRDGQTFRYFWRLTYSRLLDPARSYHSNPA